MSQPAVVEASRKFVCIRLTSYEDESEMKFCRTLYIGRSGDVENTTFTILSPDGHEPLVRTGRSAKQIWANADAMANGMAMIAEKYPASHMIESTALPVTLDARLGLDVAASDNLPLIVVVASDPIQRTALESKLAQHAWSNELVGRFTFAAAKSIEEIPNLTGASITEGVFLIEPDTFGQKGKVLAERDINSTSDSIKKMFQDIVAVQSRSFKNSRDHRAQGMKKRAYWEPKLPVTDREEANARARTKSQIDRNNP